MVVSPFLQSWQLPVDWQFLIPTVLVGDVGVNYTQENSFVNLFSKIFAIWPDFDWKWGKIGPGLYFFS